MPLAFGIIRDEFPSEMLASAIEIIAALTAVGGGLGLDIAGPILANLGLHGLLRIPFIMTSIAVVLTHVVLESLESSPRHISISAALSFSAGLVALLVVVSEAPTWGWFATTTLTLEAVGMVLLVTWVIVELQVNDLGVGIKIMRTRAVWTNNLIAFLFGTEMSSVFAFLPEFVQTPRSAGDGFSANTSASGFFLIPQSVAMFVVSLHSGKIAALKFDDHCGGGFGHLGCRLRDLGRRARLGMADRRGKR